MPKRVSLKGRGADIFFGDYSAPAAETPDAAAQPGAAEAAGGADVGDVAPADGGDAGPADDIPPILQESSLARKQESKQARKRASKHAGKQEPSADEGGSEPSRRARPDGSARAGAGLHPRSRLGIPVEPDAGGAVADAVPDAVWASVDAPATITNSFRYTDEELAALADVLYEISKEQRTRLTKQDVARLGLNLVLDEYRRRGSRSALGQLAARRQRRRQPPGGR